MLNWILSLRVDKPSFLVTLDVICVLAVVYLLVRKPVRRWRLSAPIAIVVGAAAGLIICWWASDVANVFGVPLTPITRMWVSFGLAAVALAIVNLWQSRWSRKVVALVCVPLFLVAAAAGINVDFGAYRNLSDALGVDPYPALSLAHETGGSQAQDPNLLANWAPPAGMPTKGRVGTVTIPGTVSHFDARPAVVYLPPAALVAKPPVLPVMVMFSGQPGSPADIFTAGQMDATANAFAAAHRGLAPIIVVPDQIIRPNYNPMCIDSPLGNAATYVTVDVMNWIRGHFRVSSDKNAWAIGGYSQGGTCAIQFTAAYPELFGSTLAILSELGPTIGAQTIQKAFGGSPAAYDAAMPMAIMARKAPYSDTVAFFAVGAGDAKYTRFGKTLTAAAERAGMTTRLIVSPNSAHDWNTVRYALTIAFPSIAVYLGLK